MSEMSYLEKLLDGAEVEWKPLREVCDFKNGFAFKSNLFKETGLPIVRITNIDGFNVNLDEVKYFSPNDYKEDISSFEVSMGDIVIAMSGATTGKVGFYKNETRCYLNQRVGKFVPKRNLLNNKYLYHFLLLNTEAIYILAGGGAQPNLSSNALMSKLLIPIPSSSNPEKSLAIQSEIVRILDKFTALTAELTAELTARKKQYNYYRDQLLSFKESNVAWKTLGEISRKISSGGTPKTGVTEYYDGTIPWLRTQEVDFREIWDTEIKITEEGLKTSSAKWIPKDCIIIAMYGATVGKIGINKIPMTTNQACANIQLDEEIVHYRYVFHFLCSQYAYIKSLGTGSQTNINAQIVKNIKIPVPFAENPEKSLNEQLRIVNILDKFDTLTSSITEGLPREIELRQKQYEYYRDLLFSFPKPDSVTN